MALLVVVAAHAGALGTLLWARSPEPLLVIMPTVEGVLIPVPPAEEVKAPPAPEPPKPLPVEPPKPKPKPKLKPRPKPLPPPPEGPPSERAVSAAAAEPEQAPQPSLSRDDDALGAPVIPPRVDASQLNNPAPVYPAMSRRLREQGTVFLELLILPDGTVSEISVRTSSGFARLDASALAAVKKWRYVPAKRGGVPIPFRYVQPIEFSLNR
jgi:protein TonB